MNTFLNYEIHVCNNSWQNMCLPFTTTCFVCHSECQFSLCGHLWSKSEHMQWTSVYKRTCHMDFTITQPWVAFCDTEGGGWMQESSWVVVNFDVRLCCRRRILRRRVKCWLHVWCWFWFWFLCFCFVWLKEVGCPDLSQGVMMSYSSPCGCIILGLTQKRMTFCICDGQAKSRRAHPSGTIPCLIWWVDVSPQV